MHGLQDTTIAAVYEKSMCCVRVARLQTYPTYLRIYREEMEGQREVKETKRRDRVSKGESKGESKERARERAKERERTRECMCKRENKRARERERERNKVERKGKGMRCKYSQSNTCILRWRVSSSSPH
jgi:hypothetical protein